MPDVRRFGLFDFLALVLVLTAAVTARVGYLYLYCENATTAGPLLVQDPSPILDDLPPDTKLRGQNQPTELDALIHNVKEHNWFGSFAPFSTGEETTAHVSPGYPYLLGVAARYIPEADFLPAVRWTQAGLGSLAAVFVFLFCRRAFRSLVVGTLAGLVMAVWPFAVIDTAALADGTLATFLLAATLWLGARAGATGGPMASLLLGLTLAALALTRAALLPYSVICLGWLLMRTRDVPSGWLAALVAFLGFLGGLSPWLIRNYQLYEEPVPVVSSLLYEAWIGNNPAATGGPLTPEMVTGPLEAELAVIKDQPDRYAALGKVVRTEWIEATQQSVQRRLNALLYFVFGQRWFTHQRLADAPTGSPPEHTELILTAFLLGVILFGFVGWRWSFAYHVESMPAMLAMLFVPLPYILSHAMALHGPRLPLDTVLVSFAAFGLSTLLLGRWLTDPQPEREEMS